MEEQDWEVSETTSGSVRIKPKQVAGIEAKSLPSELWLHWSKRVEGSPVHRKAEGALWCTTDQGGSTPYSVDRLSITVEMPNLTGGTERNTDAKASNRVSAHVEAYGPLSVPSFTAKYYLQMYHAGGVFSWAREDSQSL
jgi:hypothetical protein